MSCKSGARGQDRYPFNGASEAHGLQQQVHTQSPNLTQQIHQQWLVYHPAKSSMSHNLVVQCQNQTNADRQLLITACKKCTRGQVRMQTAFGPILPAALWEGQVPGFQRAPQDPGWCRLGVAHHCSVGMSGEIDTGCKCCFQASTSMLLCFVQSPANHGVSLDGGHAATAAAVTRHHCCGHNCSSCT